MEFDRTLHPDVAPSPTVASFICACLAAIVTVAVLGFSQRITETFATDFQEDGWWYFAEFPLACLYLYGMSVLGLCVPVGVSLAVLIVLKARNVVFYLLIGCSLPLLGMEMAYGDYPWPDAETHWSIVCGAASSLAAWFVLWLREPEYMGRTVRDKA